MEEGDSVESLSSRFGVSMDSIETVNGMSGPDEVVVGDVYYIPLNSVPGLPYAMDTGISPSPTPAPSPTPITFSDNSMHRSARFPYGWVFGSMGVSLALITEGISAVNMGILSHQQGMQEITTSMILKGDDSPKTCHAI
uniref:Protein kinase family protein n=1 Tax=Musa balbisiana TaxID=52838 RepID=Q1EP39_MUSBA|nr:protein kinase family protein [Musa balbisiana]